MTPEPVKPAPIRLPSREAIDSELDALEADVPLLIERVEEMSQVEEWSVEADRIRELAAPEDQAHVWSRLQCMLRKYDLIPGDDEPCASSEDPKADVGSPP